MNLGVILSEAKDLLGTIDRRKQILRFAQDDTHWLRGSLEAKRRIFGREANLLAQPLRFASNDTIGVIGAPRPGDNLTCSTNGGGGLANQRRRPCRPQDDMNLYRVRSLNEERRHGRRTPGYFAGASPSSAITFFMSAHTSFFAAGVRRRYAGW